jgi:hypothetical protein
MALLDDLRTARQTINGAASWCKGFFARNAEGGACFENNADAVQWAADGALNLATHVEGEPPGLPTARRRLAFQAVWETCEELYPMEDISLARVNDLYGHAAVLNVFDKTIERLVRR